MDLEIHVLWAWSETIAFAFSLDRSAPQVSRRQTLLKRGARSSQRRSLERYSLTDQKFWNSFVMFRQFLSPIQEGVMLEVHRESGGFTPWNACPVKCLFLFDWGSMLDAPCLLFHWGLGHSLSRYPIKLHQLIKRVELFCFARGSPILQ